MWLPLSDIVQVLSESLSSSPSKFPLAGFGVDWALSILKGILEGLLEFITNQFLGKIEDFLKITPHSESTAVRSKFSSFAKAAIQLSPIYLVLALLTGPFYDAEEFSFGRLAYRYGFFLISLPFAYELIPIFAMLVNGVTFLIFPESVDMAFGNGGILGELQGIGLSAGALVMGGYFVGGISLISAFIGLVGLQAREVAFTALYIGYPFFSLCRVATWGPFKYAYSVANMFLYTCASLVMIGPVVALGVAAGSVLSGPHSGLSFWGRFLTWFITLGIAGYIPIKTASSVSFSIGQLSEEEGSESSSSSEREVDSSGGRSSIRGQAASAGISGAKRAGGYAKDKVNSATGGRFQSATSDVKGVAQQKGGQAKEAISDRMPDSMKQSGKWTAATAADGAVISGRMGKSAAATVAGNPNAPMSDVVDSGSEPLRDEVNNEDTDHPGAISGVYEDDFAGGEDDASSGSSSGKMEWNGEYDTTEPGDEELFASNEAHSGGRNRAGRPAKNSGSRDSGEKSGLNTQPESPNPQKPNDRPPAAMRKNFNSN